MYILICNLYLCSIKVLSLSLSDMYHRKTYIHINFQLNRVSRSVKTVHTNLFAKKNANCINLQLAIRISKNHAFGTCTIPPNGHSGRFWDQSAY